MGRGLRLVGVNICRLDRCATGKASRLPVEPALIRSVESDLRSHTESDGSFKRVQRDPG